MTTLELDDRIQHKQAIWNAFSSHYANAQSFALRLMRRALLCEVALQVEADWRRRGRTGYASLKYDTRVALYMPQGESHAAMQQAIVVAAQVLEAFSIPVKWTVENEPENGTRTHTATALKGHNLAGETLNIIGYLQGVACLRVPDGEPTMVESQSYRYVCPDDPDYAGTLAELEGAPA